MRISDTGRRLFDTGRHDFVCSAADLSMSLRCFQMITRSVSSSAACVRTHTRKQLTHTSMCVYMSHPQREGGERGREGEREGEEEERVRERGRE